jgi:hypothetical protein
LSKNKGNSCWDAGAAYEVCQYGPKLLSQDSRYDSIGVLVSLQPQPACASCTPSCCDSQHSSAQCCSMLCSAQAAQHSRQPVDA